LANQVGTAVKLLKAVDIKNLPIPVLSAEEQEKVMQSFQEEIEIEEKIEKLRVRLQSLRQEPWGFLE
jgi:restriction endonuclease S subunit